MCVIEASGSTKPIASNDRLQVIDILRGFAVIGMIVVHFYYESNYNETGINGVVSKGIELFVDSRFYTLFAILFGIGFALQFDKPVKKDQTIVSRYLRRLLVLLVFGVIVEIGFGYNILVRYAICGIPLLLIMKWPTKAVLALALVLSMIIPLYKTTLSTVQTLVIGQESAKIYYEQQRSRMRNFWKENHVRRAQASGTTNYATALSLRKDSFIEFFSDRERWLLDYAWTFLLFLIGFISVRADVLRHIRQRRKLILGFMTFGLLSWIVATWFLPFSEISSKYLYPNVAYPTELAINYLSYGLMIFRQEWLTFTYMGIILMLSIKSNWLKRLTFFSYVGRMALTNYFIQVVVVSLLFNNYAFGVADIEPALAPVYALLLFAIMIVFSRWWLSHYRFGPLEWAWRSVTYLKLQPLRNGLTEGESMLKEEILAKPVEVAAVGSGKVNPSE